MNDTKLLLTVDEAATRLGVHRTFMYGLIKAGTIPSIKLGKSRRIPIKALDEWVTERAKEAARAAAITRMAAEAKP